MTTPTTAFKDALPSNAAATSATKSRKLLRLTVSSTGDTFDLIVFLGFEREALAEAVSARSGLEKFYLTETVDRSGPVVALSSSLPDGSTFFVHDASTDHRGAVGDRSGGFPDDENCCVQRSSFGVHPRPALATEAATRKEARSFSTEPSVDDLADDDDPRRSMSAEENLSSDLGALERLNRLTTDLANERTLLAWIPTVLASVRTAFAYLAVAARSRGWAAAVTASEIGVMAFMALSAVVGFRRYRKVVEVLGSRVPPRKFGRPSVKPLTALLVLTVGMTAAGIYSRTWGHDCCKDHIV